MKKRLVLFSALMVLVLSTAAPAGEFMVYSGAEVDQMATDEANKISSLHKITSTIYTTKDDFDKVVTFYKGIAKEYKMPGQETQVKKLPSGQELKEAYFIFDGENDLMSSKLWIKVQRPYIGRVKMEGYTPKFEDIRELTSISVSERE